MTCERTLLQDFDLVNTPVELVKNTFNGSVIDAPPDPRTTQADDRSILSRPGGAGAPGLVYRCIVEEKRGSVEAVEVFYRDVKVRRKHEDLGFTDYPWLPGRGGKRGAVVEFNSGMAQRIKWFMRNCPELDIVGETSIITLTYPGEYSSDGRVVKKHLHTIVAWLRYRGVVGVWVLEFQERGAPHFMLFCNKPVCHQDLSREWYRVVGSGDERHLRAGTQCQLMKHPGGAASYAAKYASKSEQKVVPLGYEGVGNFWGHWGVKVVPLQVVTGVEAVGAARQARRGAIAKRREVNRLRSETNKAIAASRDECQRMILEGKMPNGYRWRWRPFLKPLRSVKDKGTYSKRFYDCAAIASKASEKINEPSRPAGVVPV